MTSPCRHLRPHFEFVPGIRASMVNLDAWWERAETYIEDKGYGTADTFPYESTALFRRFKLDGWAADLAAILVARSVDRPLVVVPHSNGCELVCRALQIRPQLKINSLHLVAGACEASFIKNGLNTALSNGQVGVLHVYCSANDRALKLAKLSQIPRLIGINLGYGDLGKLGPKDMGTRAQDRTQVVRNDGMDHSDWFGPNYFNELMERVVFE